MIFTLFDPHWVLNFISQAINRGRKSHFLIIFEWLFIYANCPAFFFFLIQCSALSITVTSACNVRAQERRFFGWSFPPWLHWGCIGKCSGGPPKQSTHGCAWVWAVAWTPTWTTGGSSSLLLYCVVQCPGVQVSDMEVWGCFCYLQHWNRQYSFSEHLNTFFKNPSFVSLGPAMF